MAIACAKHKTPDVKDDERFRKLLSKCQWNALPEAVQRRFTKRVKGGDTVVYVGKVTEMTTSLFGRILVNILRPFGAPLPLHSDVGTPSVVSVTEDVTTGGQIWTRLYANRRGFPQMVHSAKRFGGPTGLEEYIGFGLAMQLRLRVIERGLQFESAGYTLDLGALKLNLPTFIAPFDLKVQHIGDDAGTFTFVLDLKHKWFGSLLKQVGVYREERV